MAIKQFYPEISPSLNLDFANSKTVDPRITFTRASTATYYDGKTVAKAEENLLRYSQDFSATSWGKVGISASANAAIAPDGTGTAVKVAANASSGYHAAQQGVNYLTGNSYAISVYAKAAEYTKLFISDTTSASIAAQFDLQAITASTAGISMSFTGVVASIVDVGGGWRRCTLSGVSGVTSTKLLALVGIPDSGVTLNGYGAQYTGDGVSGIYVWGAQIEQRSQITTYTPTTDQPITRYQPVLLTAPANTPRIDHDPITGECKGLLIEEQRTNLVTYSEQFDNAAWGKLNSTIGSNVMVAPDGTLTADVLIPDTTSSSHRAAQAYTVTQNTTYTFSCYVKSAGSPGFVLNSGGSAASAAFNLLTGSLTAAGGTTDTSGVSGLITPVGNGWFRCSLTFTFVAPTVTTQVRIVVANSATNTQAEPGFTGDGYSGIYVWGAQLETGAFPTSYIKTEASQVTRAADNASMTGTNFSSWYRQDEGTLVADTEYYGHSGNYSYQIILGSAPSYVSDVIYFGSAAGQKLASIIKNSTIEFRVNITDSSVKERFKQALAFKENDAGYSEKGNAVIPDSQVKLPIVDKLYITAAFQVTSSAGFTIKRLTYYPKRLSNQQLRALTL